MKCKFEKVWENKFEFENLWETKFKFQISSLNEKHGEHFEFEREIKFEFEKLCRQKQDYFYEKLDFDHK